MFFFSNGCQLILLTFCFYYSVKNDCKLENFTSFDDYQQKINCHNFSMVQVQKKISVGMDVLKFFTMNNWTFKSDNFHSLVKTQTKSEYEMFSIDTSNGDTVEYLKTSLYGGRQYCARDPLSTLPKAKIIYRM